MNHIIKFEKNSIKIFLENDQLTKFEKDKNTEMLEINKNIEHFPINDISEDYGDLKSNIQDWKLSSLSSLTSNNYQHTDKAQIIDERTHSSASTTSSMVIIHYNY